MRANPMVAILFAIGMILPLACSQQDQGATKEFIELKALAAKGDRDAQFNVGVSYRKGNGVAKDDRKAATWFRKAAEQNHPEAQVYLGFCYAKGQGVKTNQTEVVKWWHKAAEQNHAEAQYNLGVCHANGEGVAKDFAEAVKWWRKAAGQNDPNAQYALGICYFSGEGVTKDQIEAYAWITLAGEKDEAAKRNRADVEKKLSPFQIADGDRRAKELRAEIDATLKSGGRPATPAATSAPKP